MQLYQQVAAATLHREEREEQRRRRKEERRRMEARRIATDAVRREYGASTDWLYPQHPQHTWNMKSLSKLGCGSRRKSTDTVRIQYAYSTDLSRIATDRAPCVGVKGVLGQRTMFIYRLIGKRVVDFLLVLPVIELFC